MGRDSWPPILHQISTSPCQTPMLEDQPGHAAGASAAILPDDVACCPFLQFFSSSGQESQKLLLLRHKKQDTSPAHRVAADAPARFDHFNQQAKPSTSLSTDLSLGGPQKHRRAIWLQMPVALSRRSMSNGCWVYAEMHNTWTH